MGRVCAVRNCNSGSKADIKQRQADSVRKASLLQVPKDKKLRELWSKLLQENLEETDHVCDIHFRYKDLNFSDESYIVDGKEHFIYRERITRKKHAKPMLIILDHTEYLKRLDEEKEYRLLQARNKRDGIVEKSDEGEEPMDMENVASNQQEPMEIEIATEPPNIKMLKARISKETFSRKQWAWTEKEENILFVFFYFLYNKVNCYLEIHANTTVTVSSCAGQKLNAFSSSVSIKNVEELNKFQEHLEKQKWCLGVYTFQQSHSPLCSGVAFQGNSCLACRKERLRVTSKQKKKNGLFTVKGKYAKLSANTELLRKKIDYRQKKLEVAKEKIHTLEQQLKNVEVGTQAKLLNGMTDIQQEIVLMFLKFKGIPPNRFRYSRDWICECIIMHTKSTSLYEYMRERGILPLVSQTTLSNAVGKMEAAYGFQEPVFDAMKIKAASLPINCRQGILLADEMTVSKTIGLDKNWTVRGFTDFGSVTPVELENEQADHALVLLFCPFRGKWVQPIAAFAATKTTGEILDEILLDGIKRIEATGFEVDAIGTDAATINRKVWDRHVVDENNVSCAHPNSRPNVDTNDPDNRRLWFISDASHLWKNWRTHILKKAKFWTPDGWVKRKHWELLLKHERHLKYNLKIAYFLTPDHLNPKGFQLMNVLMATQVFSTQVYLAMEACMNKQKCPEMKDAQPTINFIKRVRALIDAMTSRIPCNALQVDDNCRSRKAIIEFTIFLQDWKKQAIEKNHDFPLPNNTYVGFIVTLKATIEILDSLNKRYSYTFLMTCRLLSDPIERFFGILKIAAGCNSKPDPIIFILLFKIFCCYRLIKSSSKSPKGSNVGKPEVLQVLSNTKESKASQVSNKTRLVQIIEQWIDGQDNLQQASESVAHFVDPDHSYDIVHTEDEVTSDISGWTIRRIKQKFQNCKECIKSFESLSSEDERHRLTNAKELFNGLIRSSDEVFKIIQLLEKAATTVLGTVIFNKNLMQNLVNEVIKAKPVALVGCESHEKLATLHLITFYLERRGRFACDRFNVITKGIKEGKYQEKNHRKIANY